MSKQRKQKIASLVPTRTARQATPNAPFRRPNGIAAQRGERHGCRESREGPWMALARRPSEQRWSEASRAQRDPDAGARPFGSFWGDCQKEPAQQGGTNASCNSPFAATIHSPAKPPQTILKRDQIHFLAPAFSSRSVCCSYTSCDLVATMTRPIELVASLHFA